MGASAEAVPAVGVRLAEVSVGMQAGLTTIQAAAGTSG